MELRRQATLLLCLIPVLTQGQTIPVTGREVPALAPYENALKTIMQRWAIPGAALAITDGGRLVYARGLGYADRELGIPVQPTSLFRFASISKTLTGMTIVKLAEEGRLSLDAKFLDLIPNITPVPGVSLDPRIRQITVRQLLQHTGGWDKDIPDDWVLQYSAASRALNVPYASLTADLLCRYAISQRLDFDPGTRYSYSQTGYLLLGRIIERITGKTYEDTVREKILTPAGVTTFKLGHALLSQKELAEVKYYDYPGAPLAAPAVVPGAIAPALGPYGKYWVEQAEAYGGWIGNAIDLMKYVNALEGRRGPALLNPASLSAIIARPAAPVTPTGAYTGLTWRITPITVGQHWWHSGGATGTRNILARRQNNRDWVVLMNSRPEDEDTIITDVFNAFADAELKVASWPSNDLFADFGGPSIASVVNAANYAAGKVSPGEIVVFFGRDFGPAALAGLQVVSGRVATDIGETRVLFDGVPAPMVYAANGQVSCVVPYEVSKRTTTEVVVEYKKTRGVAVTVPVVEAVPGLFSMNSSGTGPGAFLNEDYSVNTAANPAERGKIAIFYGTGEGQTTPDGVSGLPATTAFPAPLLRVTMTIGGKNAEVLYAGAAPYMVAGVIQINARIPSDIAAGNAEVIVKIGNDSSQRGITLAVK